MAPQLEQHPTATHTIFSPCYTLLYKSFTIFSNLLRLELEVVLHLDRAQNPKHSTYSSNFKKKKKNPQTLISQNK